MPRARTATPPAVEPKPRRSAPVAERKRTPVRRKSATTEFDAAAHYDEIAASAYLNFLARDGAPGSPEDDWFQAEIYVRSKYSA